MTVSINELLTPLRFKMDVEANARATQAFILNQVRLAREAEDKRNNQMLEMFWKIASDEGTPRALFENMRSLAHQFVGTMSPQQKATLKAITVRGLFSKSERLGDEYRRIMGKRPEITVEPTQENLQEYAEQKVKQVTWDYGYRAYQAGGKENLPEGSAPSLIPIATETDKEGKLHHIFAYKNPATGLVGMINTQTDVPGDLFSKAKSAGFGPTMMGKYDFIPYDYNKGMVVTRGDKKFKVFSGVSLTTGQPKQLEIPLGDAAASGGKRTGKAINANVPKILGWMNSFERGELPDPTKAGAYASWLYRAQDLKDIKIDSEGLPKPNSEYMKQLRSMQLDWLANFPGTIPVPRLVKAEKAGPWPIELFTSGYYSDQAEWYPLQVDGVRVVNINGKPTPLWYKENVDGVGKHIWYNAYGQPIDWLFGTPPGSSTVQDQTSTQRRPAVQPRVSRKVVSQSTGRKTRPLPQLLQAFKHISGGSSKLSGLKKSIENWDNLDPRQQDALVRQVQMIIKNKQFLKGLNKTARLLFAPWTLEK